jgi:hypothetical protein
MKRNKVIIGGKWWKAIVERTIGVETGNKKKS